MSSSKLIEVGRFNGRDGVNGAIAAVIARTFNRAIPHSLTDPLDSGRWTLRVRAYSP